ncbi:hypothetical protein [Candidatus Hodgkinia cicadicola]|uniref:hypothetical protein n=1 Tax=Candidatus Hodgkinia cicadicola TaxID=573658 RepID=UPI001788A6A1
MKYFIFYWKKNLIYWNLVIVIYCLEKIHFTSINFILKIKFIIQILWFITMRARARV